VSQKKTYDFCVRTQRLVHLRLSASSSLFTFRHLWCVQHVIAGEKPRRSAWLLGQLRAWAVNGPVHFLPFSMFLFTFTVFYFYFSKYSMTIKDSTYVWKSKVSKCISAIACNMDILFIFVSNIDTRLGSVPVRCYGIANILY
jgi:hypothetical protein